MDVESPKHLERFRDQPEIKAALLRFQPLTTASEARFERAPKNTLYWPPIETLSARFLAAGRAADVAETHHFYGRPCWLLATTSGPSYAIAIASAEGAPVDSLIALLRDVSDDYWNGSSFFK